MVDALGGYEHGVYSMGDECYGCLKDLKKYWRKDDTDDDRTVARIFWDTRVLPNDLIPILLQTAGQGHVEDKRAVACADLMTAMTWPIDLAEELKELDEQFDKGADYTQLLLSHLHFDCLSAGKLASTHRSDCGWRCGWRRRAGCGYYRWCASLPEKEQTTLLLC